MKLLLHILRKDLVQMRWVLLAWLVALALPVLHGFVILNSDGELGRSPANLHVATIILQQAMAAVVAAMLVHNEPLVGSGCFWRTRPIARRTLLGAKLGAAILLFGVVPSLISVLWWAWCGFDLRQMTTAAVEGVIVILSVAIPAGAIAVLSDSLRRTLLWTVVVVLLGLALIGWAVASFGMARDSVTADRVTGFVVLAEVVMLALIVARYLSSGGGAPVGVGVLGAAVLFLATPVIPRGAFTGPRECQTPGASSVEARLVQGAVTPGTRGERGASGNGRIQFRVIVSGAADGELLVAGRAQVSWPWAAGAGFVHVYAPAAFSDAPGRMVRGVGLRLLGAASASERGSASDSSDLQVFANIDSATANRMLDERPGVRLRLALEVVTPRLINQVPLRPGRWVAAHGRGLRIESSDPAHGEPGTAVVQTRPVSRFFDAQALGYPQNEYLLLVNPARRECTYLPWAVRGRIGINGVEISRTPALSFSKRQMAVAEMAAWLKDAVLAELVLDVDGAFTREVDVPSGELFAPDAPSKSANRPSTGT